MDNGKKRQRSSNWDEEEKKVLRQLVTERINIIEKKDSTTITNNKRKAAWLEILSCFNSINYKKRNLPQLMTQWRRTKWLIKKSEYFRKSECRQAKLLASEGSPPPSPPTEDVAILQFIMDDDNMHDSKDIYIKNMKQSLSSIDNDQFSESPDTESTHDTDPLKHENMETPSSPILSKTSRKRTFPPDDRLEETLEVMHGGNHNLGNNEFDVYGQYVATELRQVKDERSVVIAKYYINKILFESRMGKFRGYSVNASPRRYAQPSRNKFSQSECT